MRPWPGVNLSSRPDLSGPDELVVEITIDVEAFRAAMEAAAGAARELAAALSRRDPEVLRAMSGIAERARQTRPTLTGAARAGPQPPEQVDDGQAHDWNPDRCWKCDAKPGVEELDGACWRCWYKLTGWTTARKGSTVDR